MDPYLRRDYQFNIHQNAFYKLHPEPSKWTEAISICDGEGSHLAVPETAAEAKVIIGVMKDDQQSIDISEVYVGIHDLFMDGMFVTVDATALFANTGMGRFFRPDYQFDFDQTAFYKLHTTARIWTEALSTCEAEGATLSMPENPAEAEVMVRIMREQLPQEHAGVFVGIHSMFTEDTYVTLEGTDVRDGWSEWINDISNDTEYELKGDGCGLLLREGKLERNYCFLEQAFICKKTLNINLCGTADTEYFADDTNTKCYKLHQQRMNWTDAYATCVKERAYLAIINSDQESRILENKLRSVNDQTRTREQRPYDNSEYSSHDHVWLGFHNKFFHTDFTTVKGYPLSKSGYAIREIELPNTLEDDPQVELNPNTLSNHFGDRCGTMYPARKLSSMPCGFMASFFCERDLYTRV